MMEILNSAITGAFVGLIWALIKVVEYFIKKYSNADETPVKICEFKDFCDIKKKQVEKMEDILLKLKKIDEMHNVYNDDHVPAWYVPSELLPLVRESNHCLENLDKSLEVVLDEIKTGQSNIINRMTDLITSQKLMTERLSDLISALNKLSH